VVVRANFFRGEIAARATEDGAGEVKPEATKKRGVSEPKWSCSNLVRKVGAEREKAGLLTA
jgi:hypothetical protein